jgi:hypothetical protein
MRILISFVTGTALLMTAALTGCVDPSDPFDTTLTTATTANTMNGDGDGDGETGVETETTGDEDGCVPAMIGGTCDDTCGCAMGLTCDDGTCSLGGGDGDGDGDGDPGGMCTSYDPMMCTPPGQPITVMGVEGSFCTCACTSDGDCPGGPVGTQGACALQTPDMMMFCGLICSVAMDACPEGASCKSAGQMNPDIGLCTFP